MPSRDPDRPNILSILADDHGFWALGCAGNDEIQTPNLDRLAGEGLRLENLFCASPVCSPARASLLTGRIPSQHGVHDFLSGGNTLKRIEPAGKGRLIQYLDHCPAYTEVLAEAGYACGLSGKWHLGDCHHAQKGFSFWKVHVRGGGPYYGAPMAAGDDMIEAPEYVTDLFTRNALAFLDTQADSDAPFHLGVHYTAPHSPWSRKNHPHETWDRYFEDCPFASVPDLPVHPCQVRYLINPDRSNRRELLAGYYTAVTEMDRCIGELLDRLEAMGIAENTLVLFTSDNGMSMGHHGIYGKGNGTFPQNMFETAVKVPGILRLPGRIPAGRTSDALVSHLDIAPTLLELAGLEMPDAEALPGRSVLPLLEGKEAPGREEIVIHEEYGPVRMIRTRDGKYIHRHPYGPHELYHLAEDPDEETNRYNDPALCEIQLDLFNRLGAWFERYADPEFDGSRLGVTGGGQFDRVGRRAAESEAFLQVYPCMENHAERLAPWPNPWHPEAKDAD